MNNGGLCSAFYSYIELFETFFKPLASCPAHRLPFFAEILYAAYYYAHTHHEA